MQLSKQAFWDTDVTQLDEKKHAAFIITRVFQYGMLDDIRAVLKRFSGREITEAFRQTRGVDKKAKALAAILLEVREEEL